MQQQQFIGLALVALQAALMGLLARTVWFPVLVVVIAFVGTVTKWRISFSREQAFLLSAMAAFFFLLKHRFSPQDFPIGSEFIRTEVAFIIAQFLLLIEAVQFVLRREGDRLSPVLPALGAVALICIADIQVTNEQRIMTQFFAIAYPLLWGMFLWTGRNPLPVPPPADAQEKARRLKAQVRRRCAAGMVLSVIANTALIASLGLYELEKKIEGWMLGLISGSNSQVRFSRSAKLGSVVHKKTQAEEEIALWAYSETFPGYLRGAVFAQFEASEWKAPLEYGSLDANPASERPKGLGAMSESEFLFSHGSITPVENSRWQTMECWLKQDQESAAFTPQGTTHLIVQGDRLGLLPFGVFVLKDLESSNPYIACVPDRIAPDSPDFQPDDRWLQIPEEYQSELNKLARRIFANSGHGGGKNPGGRALLPGQFPVSPRDRNSQWRRSAFVFSEREAGGSLRVFRLRRDALIENRGRARAVRHGVSSRRVESFRPVLDGPKSRCPCLGGSLRGFCRLGHGGSHSLRRRALRGNAPREKCVLGNAQERLAKAAHVFVPKPVEQPLAALNFQLAGRLGFLVLPGIRGLPGHSHSLALAISFQSPRESRSALGPHAGSARQDGSAAGSLRTPKTSRRNPAPIRPADRRFQGMANPRDPFGRILAGTLDR